MGIKHLWFFIASICLVSCSQDLLFSEVKSLGGKDWSIDSTLTFKVTISPDEITENDTLFSEIIVRHSGNYEYQNLWLFAECVRPDSSVMLDTINIYLADNWGRWMGDSGIGSLYTVTVPMPKQCITSAGVYSLSLSQGMRMENVNQISDIGLNVYNSVYLKSLLSGENF